jgi:hypothetical protein
MIIKVHDLNKIDGRITEYIESKQRELDRLKEVKSTIDLKWFKNKATTEWSEFLGKAIKEEERTLENLK